MTGTPPQNDIMKHNIVFHYDAKPPSPETPTCSRKRKQELQYPSLETHVNNTSFDQYRDIYSDLEYHSQPFQHDDIKDSFMAQHPNQTFQVPVEPLVSRSTPPFQPFLPHHSDTNSVGESQGMTEMVVDFDSISQSESFPKMLIRNPDLHTLQRHPWDNSSPIQSPTRYSPGTPGFFTPGFLESLNENEVYDHQQHPLNLDWSHTASSFHESEEYNPLLVKVEQTPEKSHSATSFFTTRSDKENDRSLVSRRSPSNNHHLFHLSSNETKIKSLIQTYLAHSVTEEAATHLGEKTVIVLTSKVAQKSYGTEKRFLCPPPTAILIGTSWWTAKEKTEGSNEVLVIPGLDKDIHLVPPKLTVSISGENSAQGGQIEWYTVSGETVGQTGQIKPTKQESTSRFRNSESRQPPVEAYKNEQQEPLAAGKSVSKQLYINDADEKRKCVDCLMKIRLANGIQLGALSSKPIKVISKPSKKRQNVKNMELCIHHGTTVSLFNRIRSQTVSTKYLGVSTNAPLSFPGTQKETKTNEGTCFVARTTSWDPFVIWIVDPTSQEETNEPSRIFPPPPAIALKNKTGSPIPVHYNQHIVLQCLTTGLVSPVMIIRKVDRASTVVGGAQTEDELGEEVLGDPVSQLHKIALQIVQEPSGTSQTYLACLNDVVGMHKTSEGRKPMPVPKGSWDDPFDITSQEGGKVIRKRRVSSDVQMNHPPEKLMSSMSLSDSADILRHQESTYHYRRRVNSLNEDVLQYTSVPQHIFHQQDLSRKSSISSSSSTPSIARRSSSANTHYLGAFWCEDVSDAAVWTIVGTECATYTFWMPSLDDLSTCLLSSPFPLVTHSFSSRNKSDDERILTMHGENFSRDLEVWFGDVKSSHTEYRSKELLICRIPFNYELEQVKKVHGDIPILFVRGDSTICKTGKYFPL